MAQSYIQLIRSSVLILAIHILTCTVLIVDAQNTNFSYLSFSTPEPFLMVQDVQYYADQSCFLMNSRAASMLSSSCGRLLYNETVRMKDSPSGAVASFQTAFTFNIIGSNSYNYPGFGYVHADGLAFTFARAIDFQGQNPGGTLCLISAAGNGDPSNRVFAVEFDTFPNYWYDDPSDSHIGVDVNSMNSTWSYNLCGGDVYNCSYLCNGGFFTAWIDYDSASQKLEVFFANGSLYNNTAKPRRPVIQANLSLSELLDDDMYVGFSSSTGKWSEVHQIMSWKFTTIGMPDVLNESPSPAGVGTNISGSINPDGSRRVGIIAGFTAGAAAALLAVGFFIARHRSRKSSMNRDDKFNLLGQNLVPRAFTYKELTKATKNFSRSELLGSGGFGAVYKGTLPSGAVVAVKWMRHESKRGEESFQAEAASLSQIRHRNLVQLRGWCSEEEKLFLVYDYMRNGSLDEWLYQSSHRKKVEPLPLTLRHSVLSGVATALSYLHEECAQCVLHRDIKSSNVLLDGELNAYLGDFGLARLIDHQKMEKTTMMAGTLGYMAPEMPHTGKATKETDVFSFGVLILEVMCGTRPLESTAIERGDGVLVDRVWRAHEAGYILQAADPRLRTFPRSAVDSSSYSEFESQDESSIIRSSDLQVDHSPITTPDSGLEEKSRIVNLLQLGLLCCNPNPEDRPSMRLVSQLLQISESEELLLPPLPVCKPQARHSKPGFSQFVIRSAGSSPPVSAVIVQDAGLGSSYSIPPVDSEQRGGRL
ncbi:hypothetical protein M758_2G207200 [Ceratodon purpureus]|nr:hypothetical protein M758_2G207200 [Ceratodon purpureus]